MSMLAIIELCCLAHIVLAAEWFDSSDEEAMNGHDLPPPSFRKSPYKVIGRADDDSEDNPLTDEWITPNTTYAYEHELTNYYVQAIPVVDSSKYPWLARVSHPQSQYPLCTASCIKPRLFLVTATCVERIRKPEHISVFYSNVHFAVKGFSFSYNTSVNPFNEIGFVVTKPNPNFTGKWSVIKIPAITVPRKEYDKYDWFEDLHYPEQHADHTVIGYACLKNVYRLKTPDVEYRLVELPVIVGIHMCEKIFEKVGHLFQTYHIPCFLSCTLEEFQKKLEKCKRHLGAEGAPVVSKNGTLLGVSTWGVYANVPWPEKRKPLNYRVDLWRDFPVGLTVVTDFFQNDFLCALAILETPTKRWKLDKYCSMVKEKREEDIS